MTKILHTADIHLDSPLRSLALRDPDLRDQVHTATRSAFTRIIDTAIAESVNALLIAGDLFDGAERSARTAAYLTGQLDRLRDGGIRVFYIKGNHDAENPLTGELNLPENVHIFDGRGGKVQLSEDVWIHGVSFANRHAPESLLPKFPAPVSGAINIAMLHTSLAGAGGHDPYRDKHRSDMMDATERAFSELTNGAYVKLLTQPDGSSEILLAVDANGTPKQIGDMSKGTRFQLYLALRAAAYEQMVSQGVQLPFFCDDVFETFDEDRTRAACRLMERIGRSGQAIYLTHHRHVVEIAKEVCDAQPIIHEI